MNLRYKVAWGLAAAAWLGVAALALTLSYSEPCGEAPSVRSGIETMNAYVFRCYGSPEVLSFEEVAKPAPGEGDVLVKVKSASVNPLDWHHMRGSPYFMRLGLGIGAPQDVRFGVDFSGAAIGSSVSFRSQSLTRSEIH